jgi:uncharacterized protein YuzE
MAASIKRVGQFKLSYDQDADVLYISIGSPRPAHIYEEEWGLLIRKDPKTGETVGVTILDYEELFRKLPDLSWLVTKSLPEELLAYLWERPALHP